MKHISKTYRFLAIILAFLMFLTSVGFNLDVHLCQGKLRSFNFFGKAKNCYELADEMAMKNCVHHAKKVVGQKGCSMDKKDCCENKTFHIQSDQNQENQPVDFQISESLQQFIVAFVASFYTDFQIEKKTDAFIFYSPPFTPRDIYVLNQSFLL